MFNRGRGVDKKYIFLYYNNDNNNKKIVQRKMIEQLSLQLTNKNQEHKHEQIRLKHLKERFDTLKKTGTPFVLYESNVTNNIEFN